MSSVWMLQVFQYSETMSENESCTYSVSNGREYFFLPTPINKILLLARDSGLSLVHSLLREITIKSRE